MVDGGNGVCNKPGETKDRGDDHDEGQDQQVEVVATTLHQSRRMHVKLKKLKNGSMDISITVLLPPPL